MKIKYYEYGKGTEYGEDHRLTDNWNPDKDYGNEYVNVYFNIDTPSYDFRTSFETNEDAKKWHNEVSNVIYSCQIEEGTAMEMDRDKCKSGCLYPHPQQISGTIKKNDVKKVAEAIDHMALSSIRWVDIRQTVYDIPDSQYLEYLYSKQDDIRKLIFKFASTNRTAKYCRKIDVLRRVADHVRLQRLFENDGKNYGSGMTIEYVENIADTMVQEGLLIITVKDNCTYIRSLNKTEQKKYRKTIYLPSDR